MSDLLLDYNMKTLNKTSQTAATSPRCMIDSHFTNDDIGITKRKLKSTELISIDSAVYRLALTLNRCSAVAEIGDRLAAINMGPKEGGAAVPLSRGSWVLF